MSIYSEFETKTSYRYLQQIVGILEEPICILGGWAVYIMVNDNFKKQEGRNYLGSRDIDLGFHLDDNLNKEQLKDTTLAKSLSIIVKEGFKPQGFRYYKEINYETGKELKLDEAKKMPSHNIFTMYIDPIVDNIHPSFKEIFSFNPVDESLLKPAFQNKKNRKELKEFNKLLWLPSPEILLATKIKSIPNRTKDEKLVKDVCDIYVLSWFSGEKFQNIKNKSRSYLDKKIMKEFRDRINSETDLFEKAQIAMDIDAEIIENLFKELIE